MEIHEDKSYGHGKARRITAGLKIRLTPYAACGMIHESNKAKEHKMSLILKVAVGGFLAVILSGFAFFLLIVMVKAMQLAGVG